MDWILKTKFTHWVIIGLVVLNVCTVGFIWLQTTNSMPVQVQAGGPRHAGSLELLKQTLDLSDDQARQFQQRQSLRMGQLSETNNSLDLKKKELAEEVFASNSDTVTAHSLAEEIGEREAQVEMQRFLYFRDLLAVCTPEQREKMTPIVMEVMGKLARKKNDRPDTHVPEARMPGARQPNQLEGIHGDDEREIIGNGHRDDHPNPSSVDEKLAKLSRRLDLTFDQVQRVKAILLSAQHKNDELRSRPHPDREEIESAKEGIRKEEDASIMKILTEAQRSEYTHMMDRRKK